MFALFLGFALTWLVTGSLYRYFCQEQIAADRAEFYNEMMKVEPLHQYEFGNLEVFSGRALFTENVEIIFFTEDDADDREVIEGFHSYFLSNGWTVEHYLNGPPEYTHFSLEVKNVNYIISIGKNQEPYNNPKFKKTNKWHIAIAYNNLLTRLNL